MMHLLWGTLNIGLFLFFIVICFKATKIIREQIGIFAAVVFVFGLLSFVSGSNNDNNIEPNSNQIKTWELNKENNLKTNETDLLRVTLEKNLVSENALWLKYGQEKQSNIPLSAYSDMTGLTIGRSWNTSQIMVNKTADSHKFEYFVNGVVEWKLLGATIYTEPKEYKGFAFTK